MATSTQDDFNRLWDSITAELKAPQEPPKGPSGGTTTKTPKGRSYWERTGGQRVTVDTSLPSAGRLDAEPDVSTSRYSLRGPQRAPSFGSGTAGPKFNQGTVARLTIVSMGVAGAAVAIKGRNNASITENYGGHAVSVPGNMRAYAAVIVIGTMTLVVNEISPQIAMVMAGGLALIALTAANAFTTLGNLFAPSKPITVQPSPTIATPGVNIPTDKGSIYTGPSGLQLVPVPGKPGNYSFEPINPPNPLIVPGGTGGSA